MKRGYWCIDCERMFPSNAKSPKCPNCKSKKVRFNGMLVDRMELR